MLPGWSMEKRQTNVPTGWLESAVIAEARSMSKPLMMHGSVWSQRWLIVRSRRSAACSWALKTENCRRLTRASASKPARGGKPARDSSACRNAAGGDAAVTHSVVQRAGVFVGLYDHLTCGCGSAGWLGCYTHRLCTFSFTFCQIC